jgi:hypothetical protein
MNSRTNFPFAGHALLFAGLAFTVFHRNAGNMFVGLDGTYMLTLVARQFDWLPPAIGFAGDPFRGLGDMSFALNARLLPGYFIPALVFGGANVAHVAFQALAATIFAVEIFVAVYVLGRSLQYDRLDSSLAPWLLVPFIFPFFAATRIYPIIPLIPHMATAIATTALLVSLFAWQGRAEKLSRYDVARFVAAYFLAAHLTLAQPLMLPLAAAVFIAAFGGLLYAASSRAEVLIKLATAGALALLLLLTGFAAFGFGIFEFSASRFWSAEFESYPYGVYAISMLFHGAAHGIAGPMLFGAAILGIVTCALSCQRPLARIAIATLVFLVAIFVYGAVALTLGYWKAPLPLYFEFFALPVLALFAARFIAALVRAIAHRHQIGIRPVRAEMFCLACIVVVSLVVNFVRVAPVRTYPLPPAKPPMIAQLAELAAMSAGQPFRGRVVTLFGQSAPGKSMGWLDLHVRDNARIAAAGNDFHTIGLWAFNIPTLFEYSQTMSAAYYGAMTRLLAGPNARQLRNVIVLRRADPKALALFGVRYVISDAPQPEPFVGISDERTSATETLYLYEVPNPNLGHWSVVGTRTASNFENALAAVAAPDFDPQRAAILIAPLDDRISAALLPAQNVSLIVEPSAWRIEATSAGTSLLVLPIEFSRCLNVVPESRSGPDPILLRVNAVQTGVLFSGRIRARIRYFTGPFENATCRINDARELAQMLQ